MASDDMPELDLSDVDLSDVDLTPVLLRKMAWDTMPCPEVPDLLTALALTHGTDEGMHLDHVESHRRLAAVFPLEGFLQRFSEVLGVVVATAMTERAGVDLGEESVLFAEQNAEVILAGTRAIIGQFVDTGVLVYGPRVQFVSVGGTGE